MKHILLSLLLLFSFPYLSSAQEIAMDFDRIDCDGQQHHLFSQLDSGKVVIVEFVMLNCSPCIVATNALDKILKSYDETNPGRVKLYSFGFLDSYTCENMDAWKRSGYFTHQVFTGGSEQVQYYGGMGMPTLAVTGTDNHKVFFKTIGYEQSMDTEIKAAIDSALLYSPLGIEETIESASFSIYPSVFSENFRIKTNNVPKGSCAIVYDLSGNRLLQQQVATSGNTLIQASRLPKGLMVVRLESSNGISSGFKVIKQ